MAVSISVRHVCQDKCEWRQRLAPVDLLEGEAGGLPDQRHQVELHQVHHRQGGAARGQAGAGGRPHPRRGDRDQEVSVTLQAVMWLREGADKMYFTMFVGLKRMKNILHKFKKRKCFDDLHMFKR